MPIYEYKCEGCGDVFEQIQRFSDEPLKVHEKCGGAVHRLLSAPALQFKGSGWYITDYAKSGGPSNGTKKSEGDSSGESKSTSSSDSTNSSSTKSESAKPAASTSEK